MFDHSPDVFTAVTSSPDRPKVTTPHLKKLSTRLLHTKTVEVKPFAEHIKNDVWNNASRLWKDGVGSGEDRKSGWRDEGHDSDACDLMLNTLRGYYDAYMDIFAIELSVHRSSQPLFPHEKKIYDTNILRAKAELAKDLVSHLQQIHIPPDEALSLLGNTLKNSIIAAYGAERDLKEPHDSTPSYPFRAEPQYHQLSDHQKSSPELALAAIVEECERILDTQPHDKKSPAR